MNCFSLEFNKMFSLHAVEVTIEYILRKRAKTSRTKKVNQADKKKKTPIIEPEVIPLVQDTFLPQLDAPLPEP